MPPIVSANLGQATGSQRADARSYLKINEFRAPGHLVHIFCGQGVEKHVHKPGVKRPAHNFYAMPNFLAFF